MINRNSSFELLLGKGRRGGEGGTRWSRKRGVGGLMGKGEGGSDDENIM